MFRSRGYFESVMRRVKNDNKGKSHRLLKKFYRLHGFIPEEYMDDYLRGWIEKKKARQRNMEGMVRDNEKI